ncbi:hypothetical protein Plhal703r1_c04g0025161 [Plasmopara halstedii]
MYRRPARPLSRAHFKVQLQLNFTTVLQFLFFFSGAIPQTLLILLYLRVS